MLFIFKTVYDFKNEYEFKILINMSLYNGDFMFLTLYFLTMNIWMGIFGFRFAVLA